MLNQRLIDTLSAELAGLHGFLAAMALRETGCLARRPLGIMNR